LGCTQFGRSDGYVFQFYPEVLQHAASNGCFGVRSV
jgi:hypothetical protein